MDKMYFSEFRIIYVEIVLINNNGRWVDDTRVKFCKAT